MPRANRWANRIRRILWRSSTATLAIVGVGALVIGVQSLKAQGSPGPGADACGPASVNPTPGRGGDPIFPPGQYPVKLPAMSLLGAPNNLPNPYGTGADWGQLPSGRVWGSTASVSTGPDGNIWVVDRCGHSGAGGETCGGASSNIDPIFEFDTSGKLLKHFGAGLFVSPHKLEVDKQGNIWVADNGGDQVFKLDQNGKVLMTLGKKGMGPGEFDVPHTLAMDSKGRLYVGDRQNNRIQIFDQNGKFIAQWFQFGRPSGIYIDKNDMLYSADSESRDGRTNIGRGGMAPTGYGYNAGIERGIRIGSVKDGKVKYFIPDPCPYPYNTGSDLAEGVTTDAAGNVYGADFRGDVRKFTLAK